MKLIRKKYEDFKFINLINDRINKSFFFFLEFQNDDPTIRSKDLIIWINFIFNQCNIDFVIDNLKDDWKSGEVFKKLVEILTGEEIEETEEIIKNTIQTLKDNNFKDDLLEEKGLPFFLFLKQTKLKD